jgi:hypothetical protein
MSGENIKKTIDFFESIGYKVKCAETDVAVLLRNEFYAWETVFKVQKKEDDTEE